MFVSQSLGPRHGEATAVRLPADGTLPLSLLPPALNKYAQLPDLYHKVNSARLSLAEITPLFLQDESQASISPDVDNRVTTATPLAII